MLEEYIKKFPSMKKFYTRNHDGEIFDWREFIQECNQDSAHYIAAPRSCFTKKLSYDVAPLIEFKGMFQKIRVKRKTPGSEDTEEIGYWWAQILDYQGYYWQMCWYLYTPEEHRQPGFEPFWSHVSDLGLEEVFSSANPLPPKDIPGLSTAELVERVRKFEETYLTDNALPMLFQGVPNDAVLSMLPGAGTKFQVRDFDHVNIFREAELKELCGFRPRLEVTLSNGKKQTFTCDPNWEWLKLPGWAESAGIQLNQPNRKSMKSRRSVKCGTKKPQTTTSGSDTSEEEGTAVDTGIATGQLFEMIHPTHFTSIVAAEVTKVLKTGYFKAKITSKTNSEELDESANGTNEFVLHIESPYIFPCGTCKAGGQPEVLEPPVREDGETPIKKFDWPKYFEDTGKGPLNLPERESGDPRSQFKTCYLLESTDLSNVNFIAPALVVQVLRPHLIKLRFLGWEPKFDQWRPTMDPHLYPIGWTKMMKYPLSPPGSQTEPAISDAADIVLPVPAPVGAAEAVQVKVEPAEGTSSTTQSPASAHTSDDETTDETNTDFEDGAMALPAPPTAAEVRVEEQSPLVTPAPSTDQDSRPGSPSMLDQGQEENIEEDKDQEQSSAKDTGGSAGSMKQLKVVLEKQEMFDMKTPEAKGQKRSLRSGQKACPSSKKKR